MKSGHGCRELRVDLPKTIPVIFGSGIECRVAGDHGSKIRPLVPRMRMVRSYGILENVVAGRAQGIAFSFVIAQHMVVGLALQTSRSERRSDVFAEEFGGLDLIAIGVETEPEKVPVIGHQNVGRTNEAMAGAGVQ